MPDVKQMLRDSMDRAGITDNEERAGLAAICMGESQMLGHVETPYSHTSDDRIRWVFGHRLDGLSDPELDVLKADPKAFFNFVYDGANSSGRQLGNHPGTDDGYNYRGRYPGQITGRANYTRYAKLSGHPELVDDPDAGLRDPVIGMDVTVAYFKDRYKGGDFQKMMDAFGNNTPDIAATKERYFQEFTNSGEFNYTGGFSKAEQQQVAKQDEGEGDDEPEDIGPGSKNRDQVREMQQALIDNGCPCGNAGADGIWGNGTSNAVQAFRAREHLTPGLVLDAELRQALGL